LNKKIDCVKKLRGSIEFAEFNNPQNDVTYLGDYCEKTDIQVGPFGSQLHQEEYVQEGIPVVMPKDIKDGQISEVSIARVTPQKKEELQKHVLKAGDVLFARRGDLSKRALVTEMQEGWLCGTGTVRVRSRKLSGSLMFRLTNTTEVNSWLYDNSVGATMPNLNTAIVAAIPIRVPEDASTAIAVLVSIDNELECLTRILQTATDLRSALLSDLLSGEHEIPESYDCFLEVA
jgi:type I restriction enzyme S subunit